MDVATEVFQGCGEKYDPIYKHDSIGYTFIIEDARSSSCYADAPIQMFG